MSKSNNNYAWWIVFAGFILMFTIVSIGVTCISLFVKPVSEALGFSRTEFSLVFSIAALSMMVAAPFMGKLLTKYNMRLVMSICIIVLFIAYVLWSRCSTLSRFYMVAIIAGVSMSGLTLIPASLMVTNWFFDKRGLAMGIVFAGSGIGGMVFSPITNWIIMNHGWQTAYLSLGIIMLVLVLPVILIIVRATPGEKGVLPYGLISDKNADALHHDLTGLTAGEAIKTGSFWLLGFGLLLLSLMNMGVLQHIPAYLTDLGYSPTFASSAIAIIMAVLGVGKILLGGIFDRWGSKTGMIYACSVFILALVLLLNAKIFILVFAFALFFGLGNALTTVPSAFLTAEIFGQKSYGVIYGLMNIFITLGMAIGPPLSGAIYDSGGSYTNAWILYMVAAVLVAILTIGAVSKKVSRTESMSAKV